MRYDPELNDHGLPYNPYKSCVIPRPIGWISTVSPEGIHNLAPFSQFQSLNFDPPYVIFSANQNTKGQKKDTIINIERTGEFGYSMATYDLREKVNITAMEVPFEIDEFELAGLSKEPSLKIKPSLVAESPIKFECVLHQLIRIPGRSPMGTIDVVIGRVVMIHIDDGVIGQDGKVDVLKIKPLARLGYNDYTFVNNLFEMVIPGGNEALIRGMCGERRQ
ncbi:MAG: flavin reductase family protein [Desulfobacterota bacterium]|nr:flavin reductase family protein [Thermodesulfobacteriota bacterium]MDW8002629.1 flavin reductase family protein [Deltaproteobacteria bacterium]